MSVVSKINPVGIDKPIDIIQNALFNGLVTNGSFVDYTVYPRVYVNESKNGIKPENYTSKNEYKDVFVDDGHALSSFVIVDPSRDSTTTTNFTPNISIIFQARLDKLITGITHRPDEEFNNQVAVILNKLRSRGITLGGIVTGLENVYAEFDTTSVKWDDMNPFYVVRFNLTVSNSYDCALVLQAPTTSPCTLTALVTVENESGEDADDGTAIATATTIGGAGPFTYSWTGPNGFTSTLQAVIGLAPGTYEVTITDLGAASCVASDSGVVAPFLPSLTTAITFTSTSDAPTMFSFTYTGTGAPSTTDGTSTYFGTNPEFILWNDNSPKNVVISVEQPELLTGIVDWSDKAIINTIVATACTSLEGDFDVSSNGGLLDVDFPVSSGIFDNILMNDTGIGYVDFTTLSGLLGANNALLRVDNCSLTSAEGNHILDDLSIVVAAQGVFTGRLIEINGNNEKIDTTSGGIDGIAAIATLATDSVTTNFNADTDADADAFIAAAAITGAAQKAALNQLVLDLKGIGSTTNNTDVWSDLHAFYPFCPLTSSTASLDACKYNLVNPLDTDAAFRITWANSPIVEVTGVTGNGTSMSGDTHFIPSVDAVSIDDISISALAKTTPGGSANVSMGYFVNPDIMQVNNEGPTYTGAIGDLSSNIPGTTNVTGLITVSRTASNLLSLYLNGAADGTDTSLGGSLGAVSITVLARNSSGGPANWSLQRFTNFSIAKGLSSNQAKDMNDALTAFDTALSR